MMAAHMSLRILLLPVALLLLVAFAPAAARGEAKRPNVLMIAVDDLNDWVGPLGGHPQAREGDVHRPEPTRADRPSAGRGSGSTR